MSKEPVFPPIPRIDLPSQGEIDKFPHLTPKDLKALKKSDYYKKLVQPTLDRRKKLKRERRKEWWWSKGLQILNLLLTLIAAITGIIALIRQ